MYRSYTHHSMDNSASPVYGVCGRRTNYILGAGIVLALIGASLLVAFGLLYVRPYISVRHLVEARCTTNVAVAPVGDPVSCTCVSDGTGSCTSQYPCVHIAVNYTTKTDENAVNATLYDSYETYTIQSIAHQCSFHKCDRVVRNNAVAVLDFVKQYGDVSTVFACYVDPSNASYAIQDVVTQSMVVHSMFWPTLSLIVGLAIVLVYIFRIDSGSEGDEDDSGRPLPSSLERRLVRVGDRTMILSGEEQGAN